jgi:parallel beta-helix repeat protein
MFSLSWLRSSRSGSQPKVPPTSRRRPRRRQPARGKPNLEPLEDRLVLATLLVNTTADNTTDTSVLTLRDAITLVNNAGNPASLGQASMPASWASQINTTNPFGSNDTIQFNLAWNDPGHVYYRDDGVAGHVSLGNVTPVPANTASDADLANAALVGTGNTIDPDGAHSWWSIQPHSSLPLITAPVVIDGYTQPGASPNTLANGDNAVLRIELNGAQEPLNPASVNPNYNVAYDGVGLTISAGGSTVRGLAVNGFSAYGLWLYQNGGDTVAGNFIGTDVTGQVAKANGWGPQFFSASNWTNDGLSDWAGHCMIGGSDPGSRNLVSGNAADGMFLRNDPKVEGNFIGTDASGTHALGNGHDDIYFDGGGGAVVGGLVPGARNVISGALGQGGSYGNGIRLTKSSGIVIEGNYIGTDVTGSQVLGNAASGVGIFGSSNTTVGGVLAGAGNVISGNGGGIADNDSVGTVIQGNFIGTNASGTRITDGAGNPLNKGFSAGIFTQSLAGDVIGGTTGTISPLGTAGFAGNLISGTGTGIYVFGSGNLVQGNFIGTDWTGLVALGNYNGIAFAPGSANNRLLGNVISGSFDRGIENDGSSGNVIQGNKVGTDPAGNQGRLPGWQYQEYAQIVYTTSGLGNGGYGVGSGGSNNQIGGLTTGAGNTIAFNRGDGVNVSGGTGNSILGNSIHDNGSLGIELTNGANDNQAAPVLTSAATSPSGTTISGTLQSVAGTTFRVEFFANAAADPSGYGEGQTYLGFALVATDANGYLASSPDGSAVITNPGTASASYTATLTSPLPTGQTILSATATRLSGTYPNLVPGDTSQFARDVSVPVVSAITAPLAPVAVNMAINVSASFTDALTTATHTALWNWGDGTTSAGTVTETNGSGTVTGSHTYTTDGVYTVTLTVTEANGGGSGQSVFQYVVVYNPSAGFVTGGGWITSPAGAYAANPALTGKANFGLNAKYKNGATVPTGNTDFQFPAANLTFQSTSYDWLVITTNQAQYQGSGTLNGAGNYGFLVTALDGGGHGADRFRLQIWDKNNGNAVVYDTQPGAATTAAPTTALGGGRIQVHTNAQLVAGGANPSGGDVAPLTPEELQPVVQEAIARWAAAGIDPGQVAALRQVTVGIAKFPGPWLGMAFPGAIWIDQTAAGYGWYLDPSPAGDGAFPAAPGSPAFGKVDLLTVVEHELGHELGLADTTGDDLMGEYLPTGVRRVPTLDPAVGTSPGQGVIAATVLQPLAPVPGGGSLVGPDAVMALLGTPLDTTGAAPATVIVGLPGEAAPVTSPAPVLLTVANGSGALAAPVPSGHSEVVPASALDAVFAADQDPLFPGPGAQVASR